MEDAIRIPSNRLDRTFALHQQEYEEKAVEVLRSGAYIMGRELAAFEAEFAAFLGGGHCVGVACGLDAIRIAFHLLGVGAGDEVIVQGNTFIAGVLGITACGATPVFAEPDDRFALTAKEIEKRITKKTKAVLVTHLYGMVSPMDEIAALCGERGLRLVEDCAQAHGATYKGKMAGVFGDLACFSFYPTKILGCFGDGGAVFTQDPALADACRVYRNYGSEKKYHNRVIGVNSRLDELQAGLLRVRLSHLPAIIAEKQRLAARYAAELRNPAVLLPAPSPGTTCVWHQYVVRCEQRDALRAFLAQRGIGTEIHYPIPPHLSDAYRGLGLGEGSLPVTEHLARTVLSLPSFTGMTGAEQTAVIDAVNAFPGA